MFESRQGHLSELNLLLHMPSHRLEPITPATPASAVTSAAASRAQTFIDWTRINSRWLTTGLVAIAVVGAGYWFYIRSREIQAQNAEKALSDAKQAMQAGNLPLAQNDLQQVYAKYGSTSAGVQAAMLLAEMDYDSGKNQDGIALLQKVSGTSAAAGNEPTVRSLEGDGYAQSGKADRRGQAVRCRIDRESVPNGKGVPGGQGGAGVRGWRRHGEGSANMVSVGDRSEVAVDGERSADSFGRAGGSSGDEIASARPGRRATQYPDIEAPASVGAFLSPRPMRTHKMYYVNCMWGNAVENSVVHVPHDHWLFGAKHIQDQPNQQLGSDL